MPNQFSGRDRCSHGHLYTPENTYYKHGERVCRECHRRHEAERRERKRLSAEPRPTTTPTRKSRRVCGGREKALSDRCGRGHLYTPENTYINPKNGYRLCRKCRNFSAKRHANTWKRRNRDKIRVYKVQRKARERGAPGRCSHKQWRDRLEYYGHKCIYCGATSDITIDHLIPLSRGGSNWPSNLAPACGYCNRRKKTKTYVEFVEFLRGERLQGLQEMKVTTKAVYQMDESGNYSLVEWQGYEYDGPVALCGGGPSREQKDAAARQAELAKQEMQMASERNARENEQYAAVKPYAMDRMANGLPFYNQLSDYQNGATAQAAAPIRAQLMSRYSRPDLPSGFREQALVDFNSNLARGFDQNILNNLLMQEQSKSDAARLLTGQMTIANPLGYYTAASGTNQSIMQAPLQSAGFGGILGGVLGGAMRPLTGGR